MFRTLLTLLSCAITSFCFAQAIGGSLSSAPQPFNAFIGIEATLVAESTVDDQDTWIVEAVFGSADFEVTSVYGTAIQPMTIESTTGFYQHPLGGITPDALNPLLFGGWPELQWDSFITIGVDQTPAPVQTVGLNNEVFEAGGQLHSDSIFGGSWYVIPGEVPDAISDIDGRILLAQLTTDGFITFQANLQYRTPDGTSVLVTGLNLAFPTPLQGCEDPLACNYVEGANIPDTCIYAELHEDCEGNCLQDSDGDGICDPIEIEGCTDPAACNHDPAATDDDGTCTFDDGIRDCDGNCYNDCDGNGICEEDELFGCSYTNATNFNPYATRDDGSCEFNLTVDPEASLSCYLDLDGNGGVGAPDLLAFLTVFGTNCAP